ncbi:MAG: hypothetical protein VYC34_11445 [Planctomycetota bacterium]|nr:hypothetical protein [Planctomycetota bacterium]
MSSARKDSKRRATVIIATVIALALMNLAVMQAVVGGAADAQIGGMRIETARAFYAAESGTIAGVRLLGIDDSSPLTGEFTLSDGTRVVVVEAFDAAPADPGAQVIEGRAGRAMRRVEVEVE